MLKKIEEPGDFSLLQVGAVLTKYPLSGDYSEKVNFDDNSNLLQYEIHVIDQEAQQMALKIYHKESTKADDYPGETGPSNLTDTPVLLNKAFDSVISDKVWWLDQ